MHASALNLLLHLTADVGVFEHALGALGAVLGCSHYVCHPQPCSSLILPSKLAWDRKSWLLLAGHSRGFGGSLLVYIPILQMEMLPP